MAAVFVLISLVVLRNAGIGGYLIRHPDSVDGRSISLLLAYGLCPLALAALLWGIGWGLGRRALAALRLRRAGALDEVAAAALGLGLLAHAVFYLGWAGGLKPWPVAVLIALAAAFSLPVLPRPRRPSGPGLDLVPSAAAGLLAFGVLHLVVLSLAPPTEWDVRAHHLAIPEIYLRAGRMAEIPWLLHSHWPHLMETLYSVPLLAGRDGAAALLHAGACALLVAGVYARADGRAAALASALILAGQPAFLRGAPTAHADGACALFLFTAAAALARWEESGAHGWLAAAGLLAGSAASAKLFGAAGAASWTVWIAWRSRRAAAPALFAACAAAVFLPWLLRTWLNTGDPLWPLLGLDRAAAELAARCRSSNLWNWPPPPWLGTHYGPGFLLAPLLGLAALGRGAAPASRLERALWIPLPLLLALAARHHEAWRFLMPIYAAAAMACGRFAAAAFASGGVRRLAAAALVALGAAPLAAATQNNELFAVLGLRSTAAASADPRERYEDLRVDVAAFARQTRALLPARARVLLFREIRGYRAGFDYVWGDPMNQETIEYRRLEDPEALAARLKELGITHVLDHPGSHLYQEDPAYYDPRTLALMAECLRRRARPILARDGLVLHELL